MAPVLQVGQINPAMSINMLSYWNAHVHRWLQEANGGSKGMRIQNPQTNRYIIWITIFHWNSTTKIQEVLLRSILEGVCVHGECEVWVGLINILQFFYGQVSELVLQIYIVSQAWSAGDVDDFQVFPECLSDSINFSYILAGCVRTREQFLENIQPNAVVCDSSEETSREEFWKLFRKVNQWEIAVKCLMPVIYCIHTLQNLYAFGVCKSVHFLDSTRKQLSHVEFF